MTRRPAAERAAAGEYFAENKLGPLPDRCAYAIRGRGKLLTEKHQAC